MKTETPITPLTRKTKAHHGESFLGSFFKDTPKGRRPSLRFYRFLTMVACLLLFVLSYRLDIQILEGSLVGSRFIGFHLIDPFVTLQVIAAHRTFPVNLLIGCATIAVLYMLTGGRLFCSWACPYGFLSEIGEKIHLTLIRKKIIKKRQRLNLKAKYIVMAIFLLLNLVTGILIFETFNVVGIISRFLIYGATFSIFWVLFVLLLEIFVSRRLWCRSLCPVGATYGLLNPISSLKIHAQNDACDHCGKCVAVCHVPEILAPVFVKNEENKKGVYITSTDCTLCGRCVDACDRNGLTFAYRLKNLV
jgi:ferredoxin-type protein, NapH/MauN family